MNDSWKLTFLRITETDIEISFRVHSKIAQIVDTLYNTVARNRYRFEIEPLKPGLIENRTYVFFVNKKEKTCRISGFVVLSTIYNACMSYEFLYELETAHQFHLNLICR